MGTAIVHRDQALTGLTAVEQAIIDPAYQLHRRRSIVPWEPPGPIDVAEAVWMVQDGREELVYATRE